MPSTGGGVHPIAYGVAPCARGAGRCLRPGSPKRCRRRGTREGVPVFKAHADVRRPGRPAERRPGGFSSAVRPGVLPCGSSSCDQPAVHLADAPRVSRRFAGPRSPCIAAPRWGSSQQPGQAWLQVSVPEGTVDVPGQRCHEGHGGRQAAGRTSRNVFAGAILPAARTATQVAGQRCGTALRRQGDHGRGHLRDTRRTKTARSRGHVSRK